MNLSYFKINISKNNRLFIFKIVINLMYINNKHLIIFEHLLPFIKIIAIILQKNKQKEKNI